MTYPACPQCRSHLTYHDGSQLVCPECAYEWTEGETAADADESEIVKDANGTVLQNGDSVVLIKDLKVKGSSQVIKQGTKVKSIRLQEGDHNIGCKIDGTPMNLKSEFVKNAYRRNNKGSLKPHQTVFRLPLAWAAARCTALFNTQNPPSF